MLDWEAGLPALHARIAPRFSRSESRQRVLAYLTLFRRTWLKVMVVGAIWPRANATEGRRSGSWVRMTATTGWRSKATSRWAQCWGGTAVVAPCGGTHPGCGCLQHLDQLYLAMVR